MATSGTYNYNPSLGELILIAFDRIGIRRTMLAQEHMASARVEANNLQVEFANLQPNLWMVEEGTLNLVAGQITYTLPLYVADVFDVFIRINASSAQPIDRLLYAVSRSEYAAFPNKEQQGTPTTYWLNRQIIPTFYIWEVPNSTPYELHYWYQRQSQDAVIAGGLTPEIPYRYIDAFTAALSARLARIFAPGRLMEAEAERERTWKIAAVEDVEDVPLCIGPSLGNYFR